MNANKTISYLIGMSLLLFCSCSKVHKEFYHDGTLMSECQVKSIIGTNDGVCKNYNRDGTIVLVEHYKNGILNGESVQYYNSTKIKYRVDYKEGGLWNINEYNSADGSPLNYGSFKDGNGVLLKYSDDGKLREEGAIKNGFREGYWKLYSNKGLYDSVLYEKGVRAGSKRVDIIF